MRLKCARQVHYAKGIGREAPGGDGGHWWPGTRGTRLRLDAVADSLGRRLDRRV